MGLDQNSCKSHFVFYEARIVWALSVLQVETFLLLIWTYIFTIWLITLDVSEKSNTTACSSETVSSYSTCAEQRKPEDQSDRGLNYVFIILTVRFLTYARITRRSCIYGKSYLWPNIWTSMPSITRLHSCCLRSNKWVRLFRVNTFEELNLGCICQTRIH